MELPVYYLLAAFAAGTTSSVAHVVTSPVAGLGGDHDQWYNGNNWAAAGTKLQSGRGRAPLRPEYGMSGSGGGGDLWPSSGDYTPTDYVGAAAYDDLDLASPYVFQHGIYPQRSEPKTHIIID